ncbi:MAG: HD domain-containing protein [Myxococcota bacterium]
MSIRAMLPELDTAVGSASTVRLPGCGSVRLTRRTLTVLDHPAFQRLRMVRQLGPTSLVYPGAVHTRFEHSIGVYHAASQFVRHLMAVPTFQEQISDEDVLTVLAAALLHDLGHYPMAHSLEALHLKGNDTPRHEAIAAEIIRGQYDAWNGPSSVGDVLRRSWGVDPERVIGLFTRKPAEHTSDVDALLASIVSGALDADKVDYLERDSLHMGVPYGRNYDRERLLSSLTLASDGRSIAITDKGKTPVEIFIFGRYMMFSEAYWHHTVRAASAMVEAAISDLQALGALPSHRGALIHDLLARSDDQVLTWLHGLSPRGSTAYTLLGGLTDHRRGLYKRILTLNRIVGEEDLARAYEILLQMNAGELRQTRRAMREALNRRFDLVLGPGDLIIDTPPRDKDRLEDIEVVHPGGRHRRLQQISAVVRGIAGDFISCVKKTRVFVAPAFAPRLQPHLHHVEETLLEVILG